MATALCALIGAALLVGCAPQTSSTPTPTPHFTSEQQAYAAAEQTYRNYIDATNAMVISDPSTFEDVYFWETGDALDSEKKSLTKMHADGWTVAGETKPGQVMPGTFSPTDRTIFSLRVCMDVSAVTVRDESGKSLVRPDRPSIQPLRLEFDQASTSPTGLLISSIAGDDFACDG
ncbi:hypothetical protein [Microbacterium terrisoli]|uniref:hypothetical protein n=1 Tax=Microbacterium terrisoli TaxID=3242192 RepID=UPI002804E222|nr:hypothetical protein [Microbacterium protaetiae]